MTQLNRLELLITQSLQEIQSLRSELIEVSKQLHLQEPVSPQVSQIDPLGSNALRKGLGLPELRESRAHGDVL